MGIKRPMVTLAGAALAAGVAGTPVEPPAAAGTFDLAQAQRGQAEPGQGGRGMGPGGGGMGPGGGAGPGGGLSQSRMFQQLDRDGDGFLSREEFVEGERPGRMSGTRPAEQNRAQMFDRLDADDDGRLSRAEMPEPRAGSAR